MRLVGHRLGSRRRCRSSRVPQSPGSKNQWAMASGLIDQGEKSRCRNQAVDPGARLLRSKRTGQHYRTCQPNRAQAKGWRVQGRTCRLGASGLAPP